MAAPSVDYLYHYTDDFGFSGILESSTLWATSMFYLNDSEEFVGGWELLRAKVEEFKSKSAQPAPTIYDSLLDVMASLFGDGPGGHARHKRFPIYLTSFSEEADLLSQWRAYCPRGGFSIGFRRNKLSALAGQRGFVLQPCLYHKKEKIGLIEDSLQKLRDHKEASDHAAKRGPCIAQEHRDWDISDELLWAFLPIIPRLKHEGFFEEREWRLTSDLQVSDRPTELKYRIRNDLLVPYKILALTDELWTDSVIRIGPSAHKESSRTSICKLIAQKKRPIPEENIQVSEIPFRS